MSYVQTLKSVVPRPFWPYLGQVRRRLLSIPARTAWQKHQLEADKSLTENDRHLLLKVRSDIHYNDGMYRGDGRHYFSVGLSGIHCIDQVLAAARQNNVSVVLDMPCGHGRVLRFLVHRFPQARFIACDLDREGVNYCARTFGVEGIYSRADLDQLSLSTRIDLIWCGSLITHLNRPRIISLVSFFSRHLLSRGIVIFTAAGDRVDEWMSNREFDYGIREEVIPKICADYRAHGYAYTDYPYMKDYGISLTSPNWIRMRMAEIGGFKELFFQPHGWDNHQDVYGFMKQE